MQSWGSRVRMGCLSSTSSDFESLLSKICWHLIGWMSAIKIKKLIINYETQTAKKLQSVLKQKNFPNNRLELIARH